MSTTQIYEALLDAYGGYYNIQQEGAAHPFDAEGFFSNEAQQYFLVKAAKVASVNSYEYVFFALRESLGEQELNALDQRAWEEGLSRVKPDQDHKNTDIALIVIADKLAEGIGDAIKKISHSKNYKFGLWGFTNYRLVVIESETKTVLTNRRGRDLSEFVQQVIQKSKSQKS